jgi:pimeloyl-ACP methyl ester carboxylesterase/cell wall-associated NlpC family hydrolase
MAYIEINGAQIYYETFGVDMPGKAPILLIHGSTINGRTDWNMVSPLLARRWRVIVPDCRGHGLSNNPHNSYSFNEMADDNVALVHALGYERVHIIGHSNGGNVALVTLMQHPVIIQSAVLQAANAYVSQDLIEKEPPLFDPDRVARDAPGWMAEMIALHGPPVHKPDYWRELLQLTLKELISEPNYSPEELKRVRRPTLVIQGEKDGVNAPARHAQFMASHIPYSELWIPSRIGHSVHLEILFRWIERVEDFLERRGDEANDSLYHLRLDRFGDPRSTIFQIKAHPTQEEPHAIQLFGKVLTSNQRQAAHQIVKAAQPEATVSSESIEILLDKRTPWALVNRPVTDLRRAPGSLAERVNQALLGEAVRILESQETWSLVRTERDGYLGWIHTAALYTCSHEQVTAYQSAAKARVLAELLPAYQEPSHETNAGKLPFGINLLLEKHSGGYSQVHLPDGRLWWVESVGLLPQERWPKPDPEGIAFTLKLMKRFIGVPYMWGGRSAFGFDCSAFAGTLWSFMGIDIPRDTDQQFRVGKRVEGNPQPGDILYFGDLADEEPDERQIGRFAAINHAAISLGGDELIHATGAVWGVTYNSLDSASPRYRPWLHTHLAGARRFS